MTTGRRSTRTRSRRRAPSAGMTKSGGRCRSPAVASGTSTRWPSRCPTSKSMTTSASMTVRSRPVTSVAMAPRSRRPASSADRSARSVSSPTSSGVAPSTCADGGAARGVAGRAVGGRGKVLVEDGALEAPGASDLRRRDLPALGEPIQRSHGYGQVAGRVLDADPVVMPAARGRPVHAPASPGMRVVATCCAVWGAPVGASIGPSSLAPSPFVGGGSGARGPTSAGARGGQPSLAILRRPWTSRSRLPTLP